MKTLKFTMEIKKLDGFDEKKFISILCNNLSGVYAKEFRYCEVDNGYRFEVDFEPVLSGISYQPILGCFMGIEREYDKVRLMGIPTDEIELV